MQAKYRHDADDVDTKSIGRGSGNGTIEEFKEKLNTYLKKKALTRNNYFRRKAETDAEDDGSD